jgi:adenylate cyclase
VVGERVERRLTAILAADVAGYSRLMGADEEGTLVQLKTHRRDLVDPKIHEHRGRVVKTTGDGMLVEFASVVNAVHCATDIQRGMAKRNAGIRPEKRIEFRIGINVGDIIIDDGDIYGDGVNVAARLEGIAEPGGICVSGRVEEDTRGKLDANFEDAGEQQLKNIAWPVRVYRVQPGDEAATEAPVLPLPDKPSIAVLPFQNMSGDPEQEYFADGMVEDITTALSRVKWLFVIARNSSFTYKGGAVDVKLVASELGSATCSRAACARRETECALPASSFRRRPACTFGPTDSMASSRTSSIFKAKWPRASSRPSSLPYARPKSTGPAASLPRGWTPTIGTFERYRIFTR